jgi:drug/metabolite transporter (DMT)-like permease
MNTNRRHAVLALTAAGLLWGTTVPLSKLALAWLSPAWLTFGRFGLAAAVLLAVTRARARSAGPAAVPAPAARTAWTPGVLVSGALGYGGSVLLQNAGIGRTSVSHAALLIGAAPVMIAIIAGVWQHAVARPVAWAGFALSLAGVGLVTGGGGGGATAGGDGLVLASLLLSAAFTVGQSRVLPGRDPVEVTGVQFLGAALAALPLAVVTGGLPAAPTSPGVLLAAIGLAAGGTVLPFTLFAYGQTRVSAEVAGAFVNLEPLVGAVAGVVAFGDPAGLKQAAGGAAILAGIVLSSLPLLAGGRSRPGTVPAGTGRRPRRAPGALVHGHPVPGVSVVVGEPDRPVRDQPREREALGVGGHRGDQVAAALVDALHARAGAGRAHRPPAVAACPPCARPNTARREVTAIRTGNARHRTRPGRGR